MDQLSSRIAKVRAHAGLSKTEFGNRIGVGISSVTRLEDGQNNPSERTIKVICSEFGVNYDWLKYGTGPIYSNLPESLMDELQDEYNLSSLDRRIVEEFIKLPEEHRQLFREYLHRVFLADEESKEKEAEEPT